MKQRERSADILVNLIKENPAKLNDLAQDPVLTLEKTRDEALKIAPSYFSDNSFYRIALFSLGSVVILAIVASFILAIIGKEIPQMFIAMGSTSLGAIVGLFAPQPGKI